MTFYMVGGIVCVMTAVVLIFVYLLAHRADEHSTAAKVICWLGMAFGVAGAALMTIEYSFPNISHPAPPYVPTPMDHYLSYYPSVNTYVPFIEAYTDDYKVIAINHNGIGSYDFVEDETTYHVLNVKTEVVWIDNNAIDTEAVHDMLLLDSYCYNDDYSYQNIVTYEMK